MTNAGSGAQMTAERQLQVSGANVREWLRERFSGARAHAAPNVYIDDEKLPAEHEQRAASVLVPVIARDTPTMLFTVRASHLRRGSGQIAFPGGGAEAADPTPEHTALRESHEEIGLAPGRVEIIGRLSPYLTRAGYRVTPIIGLIQTPLEVAANTEEVAEIFEAPLQFILDPRNHLVHTHTSEGRLRRYYALQYEDYYIRGVTAGLIVNLHRHLSGG
jgi:8-oxo-dGTP pyrophosphatase MutT (NUDIX family)